jgi:hypothetical protein
MYTWFITYTCRGRSYVAAGELCDSEVEARVSLCRYLTLNPCEDEGRKVTALHILRIVKPIKYEQACLQERSL